MPPALQGPFVWWPKSSLETEAPLVKVVPESLQVRATSFPLGLHGTCSNPGCAFVASSASSRVALQVPSSNFHGTAEKSE